MEPNAALHTEKYCTVLCCSVYLVLCITVCIERCRTIYFLLACRTNQALLACNPSLSMVGRKEVDTDRDDVVIKLASSILYTICMLSIV